jgi:hypothetical protein
VQPSQQALKYIIAENFRLACFCLSSSFLRIAWDFRWDDKACVIEIWLGRVETVGLLVTDYLSICEELVIYHHTDLGFELRYPPHVTTLDLPWGLLTPLDIWSALAVDRRSKFQQEVLGINDCLRRIQQFFCYCVGIRCRGKYFTAPLHSNVRRIHIHTHTLMGEAVEMGSGAVIYIPGFIKISSGIQ